MLCSTLTTFFLTCQIALRNKEDPSNLYFDVRWLGHKRSTAESYKHLVAEGVDPRDLDKVAATGLGTKWTTWGGLSLRSGHDYSAIVSSLGGTNGIGGVDLIFMTDIDVKFQYKGARCVPYSLLNLVDAHRKKKDKLMAALGTGLCSL